MIERRNSNEIGCGPLLMDRESFSQISRTAYHRGN